MIHTREELAQVMRSGTGYIYNDFGGSDPKMCPVHTVSCTWIDRMLAVKPGPLSVRKVWAGDLPELLSWLHENGKPFTACSTCNPTCGAQLGARPSRQRSAKQLDVPSEATEASFHVSESSDDRPIVEAWSSTRLPFEPKGALLRMRQKLRDAIRRMHSSGSAFGYGAYVSRDNSLCDVENVLFYNVDAGGSTFTHITGAGVCFERAFADPPISQEPLGFEPRHYHRYEAVSSAHWRYWRRETLIGTSEAVIPGDPITAPGIWWAVRRGRKDGPIGAGHAPHRFGVHIAIRNLALRSNEILKKLLDGAVAAFHVHDGTQLQQCSQRVASLIVTLHPSARFFEIFAI